MKVKLIISLMVVLIVSYLVWSGVIYYENWDVKLTQWDRMKLYKGPFLFLGLPYIILYLAFSYWIKNK